MTILVITMVLSFVILLLVIAGMSIGVMNGRSAISGSCGGVASGGCRLCQKSCRRKKNRPGAHR